MFQHKKPSSPDAFFTDLTARGGEYVYFCRINAYNQRIQSFLVKYYECAGKNGVIIDGKIPNADQNNLSYYYEIMGDAFSMTKPFITQSIRKWLPRMNDAQLAAVAGAVFDVLAKLQSEGKNENMLKNAYVKFMCWLYYKFERITSRLGQKDVPKIMYCGTVSHYELLLISVLSKAGCDVILVQPDGDEGYLKLDPSSELSDRIDAADGTKFPPGFSLKSLRQEAAAKASQDRALGPKPVYQVVRNSWARGSGFADAVIKFPERGCGENTFNTVFYRVTGAPDRSTYVSDLMQLKSEASADDRKVVIVENELKAPGFEDLNGIRWGNYASYEDAVADLSKNIGFSYDSGLQRLMKYEFSSLMLEKSKEPGMKVNKLVNIAVIILSWIKKWEMPLFAGWKPDRVACFIYFGRCQNDNEALFLRFLSKLPTDVLIINPDPSKPCVLRDDELKDYKFDDAVDLPAFPGEGFAVRAGTSAYHAERDLDTLMYQDTGMYRNRQYSKASAIVLETTFEEIDIYWDQELKYRPNFMTDNDEVKVPVIFSKVSGVKNRDAKAYWQFIKHLMTNEALLLDGARRSCSQPRENPMKPFATQFLKNGRLDRNAIKNHRNYPYKILREDVQEYILDKLQALINSKIIKGTFQTGVEYAIVAEILNLEKDIERKIQNFDFTKKNPKIIYLNTSEAAITLSDAIILEFCSLAGFDVLFFIPTGYSNVENYYSYPIVSEHQIGEYLYDLRPPDFSRISPRPLNAPRSWRDKLFRRGV